uniref:Uncharacterized protein n=1 Tax=Cacopsylla melanoneura TaxID=428564 RepID=A0A8D8TKK0_9HEMI
MISKVLLVTIISSRFVYQLSSLPALEASSDSSVSYSIINIALPDHDYNKQIELRLYSRDSQREISPAIMMMLLSVVRMKSTTKRTSRKLTSSSEDLSFSMPGTVMSVMSVQRTHTTVTRHN